MKELLMPIIFAVVCAAVQATETFAQFQISPGQPFNMEVLNKYRDLAQGATTKVPPTALAPLANCLNEKILAPYCQTNAVSFAVAEKVVIGTITTKQGFKQIELMKAALADRFWGEKFKKGLSADEAYQCVKYLVVKLKDEFEVTVNSGRYVYGGIESLTQTEIANYRAQINAQKMDFSTIIQVETVKMAADPTIHKKVINAAYRSTLCRDPNELEMKYFLTYSSAFYPIKRILRNYLYSEKGKDDLRELARLRAKFVDDKEPTAAQIDVWIAKFKQFRADCSQMYFGEQGYVEY